MIPKLPEDAIENGKKAVQNSKESEERVNAWTEAIADLPEVTVYWSDYDPGYQISNSPERVHSAIEGAIVFGDDSNESFINFFFSRDGYATLTPSRSCPDACNGDNCVSHRLLSDDYSGSWSQVYTKMLEVINTYHNGIPTAPPQ